MKIKFVFSLQPMMYEDHVLIKTSEDDMENWAVNSVSIPIDVDEIDVLLAPGLDEDTPGHSTRTVCGVEKETWCACAAKGALNYEAQIEKNRQEYEIEKANLDIMNRAQIVLKRIRTSSAESEPNRTFWFGSAQSEL